MVVRMTFDAVLGLPYARLTLVGSLLLSACNGDGKERALTIDAGYDNTGSSATVSDSAVLVPARDAAVGVRDAAALVDGAASAASDAGAPSGDAGQVDARAVDAAQTDAGGTPGALDSGAPDSGSVVVVDPGPPDTGVPVVIDAGPPPCNASAAPVIGKLGLQTVISDSSLSNLTDAVQPPGQNDWYLVQQSGVIRVFRDGKLLATPFLDLSGEFAFIAGNNFEDRGLLSIAFAPDYATSGLFYADFTPNKGPSVDVDMLIEFKRSAADAFVADPGSRRTLLATDGTRRGSTLNTDNIHNGGRVAFGPDGKLYLAMGDGGGLFCSQVEPEQSQNVGSLFGKLLRLDLTQSAPYGALDNPFVSDGDPRVWQYGTRNPYRFTFDRATGDLYFADVGQDTFEEVDFAPLGAKGLNFGWNAYEGNSDQTCKKPLRAGSVHTPPIFVLDRSAGATGPFADYNAIIGGIVYRGKALPSLQGVYLFGANRGARLGALTHCGDTTSPVTPVTKQCNPNTPSEACLRRVDSGPAFDELRAIVEDHDGEVYVVANGNSLLKVVPGP
jgi:glucose/arabinose dehydrogenase